MAADLPNSALLTDYYELAMLKSYYERGMTGEAVFEFFIRSAGPDRPFFVAAGVERLVEWLANLRFTTDELDYLGQHQNFDAAFLKRLAALRFTGDVHALPEGTVCFADEPLVRVRAPLPEAQLIESRLMNLMHLETLIATKAARCRLAAGHSALVDFGLRRAHGAEAGLIAARACYLAGFDATATVQAGEQFGIPLAGTMAHSFILAYGDELTAFERFAHSHPNNVVLLIDTFDVPSGARNAITASEELARAGIHVHGVRIDSGDLDSNAREVRELLDNAGLHDVRIMVSGGLDEHSIRKLHAAGAPIDGFGVGSKVNTSSDVPFLDCAYKLHAYNGEPCSKRARGKGDLPGVKQIYRRYDPQGLMHADVLTLAGETAPEDGEALLTRVMHNGIPTVESDLEKSRQRLRYGLEALPAAQRGLTSDTPYPLCFSSALERLIAKHKKMG